MAPMLHHAHSVKLDPLFRDLAVGYAHDDNSSWCHFLSGGRDPLKISTVGGLDSDAGRNLVSLGYLIINSVDSVWKCRIHHLGELYMAFQVQRSGRS